MGTPVENVTETRAGDGLSEAAVQIQAAADAGAGKAAASLRELIVAIVVSPPADSRGEPLVKVNRAPGGARG